MNIPAAFTGGALRSLARVNDKLVDRQAYLEGLSDFKVIPKKDF